MTHYPSHTQRDAVPDFKKALAKSRAAKTTKTDPNPVFAPSLRAAVTHCLGRPCVGGESDPSEYAARSLKVGDGVHAVWLTLGLVKGLKDGATVYGWHAVILHTTEGEWWEELDKIEGAHPLVRMNIERAKTMVLTLAPDARMAEMSDYVKFVQPPRAAVPVPDLAAL